MSFSHSISPSKTHDVEVVMTYTDGIFSTTYTFQLNHVDYWGDVEQHIDYHMVQPTVFGTPREIMVRDVEKLKKEYLLNNQSDN